MTRVLVVALLLPAVAAAGTLRGTIFFPQESKVAEPRPLANWRVENGVLPITALTPESRTEAVVVIEPITPPEPVTTAQITVEARALKLEPHVVVAAVGTTFNFKNSDRVPRSLYLNNGLNFMAPETTPPGSTRSLRFSAAGEFELRDHDYPHARAILLVVPTTYFIHADEKGSFKIEAPDGKYTLKVFFHGVWAATGQPVEVGHSGEVVVRLTLPEEPRR